MNKSFISTKMLQSRAYLLNILDKSDKDADYLAFLVDALRNEQTGYSEEVLLGRCKLGSIHQYGFNID